MALTSVSMFFGWPSSVNSTAVVSSSDTARSVSQKPNFAAAARAADAMVLALRAASFSAICAVRSAIFLSRFSTSPSSASAFAFSACS